MDELKQYLRSIPQLEDEWDLRTEKVVKGKGHIAAIKAHVDSIYNHEPIPAPVAHDHTHHHSHDHDSSPDHGPSRNLAIITSLINKVSSQKLLKIRASVSFVYWRKRKHQRMARRSTKCISTKSEL